MTMTADARRALATTIRDLRARLITDLHDATESTYRLSVSARDAGLDERTHQHRTRLTQWIDEQHRAQSAPKNKRARPKDEFRREAELQAAYTLLNRLIILRLMEAPNPNGLPLRAPTLVTGGWQSRAYRDFRQLAPDLTRADDTEGYALLLQLAFEDLAYELPGIYGPAGVADLIPIPAATLRHTIEALDHDDLTSCWTDDMTLGWVYQYWNDPARETIDAKLNSGGKLEDHEIASKTQLFTERYMVDWLLQNSLNPMWLAMCRKHDWTPDVETDGTLKRLEERRNDWRTKRKHGDVTLTDLMPLHTDNERRWAYYLFQDIPDDAIQHAPETVRDLKILDPAAGSGHFLVIALDLLTALYREEARHRGEQDHERWSDRAIIERILSHNLHGIDIDPRAIQIAAATLWLKARQFASDATPERINLVAPNLRLASLPYDDPALTELRAEIEYEAGIPPRLTDTIVHALRGADHLGSLLKIDDAVEAALDHLEWVDTRTSAATQSDMFGQVQATQPRLVSERAAARQGILDRIEAFLSLHSRGDDLGLRLRGEQLAAGVRFTRMLHEGTYDLVVANPPYQGTSKMVDASYVRQQYPLGKADLYAAFLLRGLELTREGGVSAMLTMRNWMFIKQYSALREHVLDNQRLWALCDLDWGAFREMKDVKVAISVFSKLLPGTRDTVAIAPTGTTPSGRTQADFKAKNAGLVIGVERHNFDPASLKVIPEWPLVYWWDEAMLRVYQTAPLIRDVAPARLGVRTSDNARFLRAPWEIGLDTTSLSRQPLPSSAYRWAPYIKGAEGRSWVEPLNCLFHWEDTGLEVKMKLDLAYGMSTQSPEFYFRRGVAFSMIGTNFSARVHRYPSIFGDKGSSVFPDDLAGAVCAMNSTRAREILASLNPSISFQVGDVNRLPLFSIPDADAIIATVEAAFGVHEAHRESSVEFRHPGPSPWRHAQDWAQLAVDRPDDAPLPEYVEQLDPEPPTDHLSFALGVALGRFYPKGEGIFDPTTSDLGHTLPAGILFLDGTLADGDHRDSLGQPAARVLHDAWTEHSSAIASRRSGLREWLALDCFKDVHKGMYEHRPIHWPLSSSAKTFVAWLNMHRFSERTLRVLLADHLHPALNRIEGELADLRSARDRSDGRSARATERRIDELINAQQELRKFIEGVEVCAERGAPPTDAACPAREQDARYAPDLDDGVMINAAALWPLLDAQWKNPKKWWKELATAKGRKDYDWSHLAMRYWPTRVDAKCREDPSLAVAHGCFWRYHPQRAWAWELRLQDEIGPDFRIEEVPYMPGGQDVGDEGDAPHRARYLTEHASHALATVETEAIRRMGRGTKRRAVGIMHLLEAGLWSAEAEAAWELELRLSERQGIEFRLLAPDEPAARAEFEASHPDRGAARAAHIAQLEPASTLFGAAADDHESPDELDANEPPDDDEETA